MKYALLIDSENAEPRMDEIFQELSKYGDTPIRYLIGNFTQNATNPWIKLCSKHAITCIQTINFTKGKNSLDISLVIEGMKVLYEKSFIDGIIIIASDSDYTPLAREWRNAGKEVIGIGRKLTPESYRASCTQFIYVENIFNHEEEAEESSDEIVSIDKISAVIESVLNENNGMAQLSVVVETIRKAYTDFDVRNYGYQKARDFFGKGFKQYKLTEEKKNSFFISFNQEEKKEKKPSKKAKKAIPVKAEEAPATPEEAVPAALPEQKEEAQPKKERKHPLKKKPFSKKNPKKEEAETLSPEVKKEEPEALEPSSQIMKEEPAASVLDEVLSRESQGVIITEADDDLNLD